MWIGLLVLLFGVNAQVLAQSCIVGGTVYAPSCSSITSRGYGYPGMPIPDCPRNPATNDAVFKIKGLPLSARMWVDRDEVPEKTRRPNGDVVFRTPTLTPGARFYYNLYVRLPSDTRFRMVMSSFCAGDEVNLNSTHWGISPPPPPTSTPPPPSVPNPPPRPIEPPKETPPPPMRPVEPPKETPKEIPKESPPPPEGKDGGRAKAVGGQPVPRAPIIEVIRHVDPKDAEITPPLEKDGALPKNGPLRAPIITEMRTIRVE